MNESYGGNIPARIWARFMKAALAKTPKHDFVLPSQEVRRVTLCDSGKSEVFLTATAPARTCGDGATPSPYVTTVRKTAFAKAAPARDDAAIATPAAPQDPAPPRDAIGRRNDVPNARGRSESPAHAVSVTPASRTPIITPSRLGRYLEKKLTDDRHLQYVGVQGEIIQPTRAAERQHLLFAQGP